MSYRIRNYHKTLTVPLGAAEVIDTVSNQAGMNGLLRLLAVIPPASITGSSYTVNILGSQGEVVFSKASLAAGTTAVIDKDENSNNLIVPIWAIYNTNWLNITIAGDTAASGTITDGNGTNVSDGDIVTIGTITYRFKTVPVQANDIFISTTADLSLTNLVDAINGTGTAGTNWFLGTQASPVVTASAVSAHATTITAISETTVASSVVFTKTAASLTISGSGTLTNNGEAAARNFTIDAYFEG